MAITRKDADVNFQIIKLLLENNANVDEPVKINDNGWTVNITPLYITAQIAKRSGHSIERRTSLINIIKLLLRCGADINFFDSKPHPNRRLPLSPLTIVNDDTVLKNLLLTYFDVNLKVNSIYEKMMSHNIPQDLAAIQSHDMFDKDGISDLAETIKIAREKTESDKTANKLVAKELEKELEKEK